MDWGNHDLEETVDFLAANRGGFALRKALALG
jgi:hypothetical protein